MKQTTKKSITYKGVVYKSQRELAKAENINYVTINKLLKQGMTPDEAISKIKNSVMYKEIHETIDGVTYTSYAQIADTFGIRHGIFAMELSNGWNLQEIINGRKIKAIDKVTKKEDDTSISKIEKGVKSNSEIISKEESTIEPCEVKNNNNFNELNIQIVTSIPMLLNTINERRPKTINLIDYENLVGKCREDLISSLNDNNCINIFFFNSLIYSLKFYRTIKNSTSMNLELLTFVVANQLVDDMIKFYLGILVSHFPDINFIITSTDRGYINLVTNLNMPNIIMIGHDVNVSDYSTPDAKYKYALANFIYNNKDIDDGSCLYESNIYELFKDFLDHPSDNNSNFMKVSNLINKLCIYKFAIPVCGENINDVSYYTLNMKEVKKVLR